MFNNVQELEALLTSALQVSASLGFESRPMVTFAVIDKVKCACPVAALAMMKNALPGNPPKKNNDPTLEDMLCRLERVHGITTDQRQQLSEVAYGFDGGRAMKGSLWDTPYTDLGRKLRPAKVA